MLFKTTEIIESARNNNGSQTIVRSVLLPYAAVLPHFHTLFTETFDVIEGEIDIWNGFGKVHLEKGQTVSIEKNTLHHYVVGEKGTVLDITFMPGHLNFENAIRIFQGIERDGTDNHFSTPEAADIALLAIIMELTESNPDEETKSVIDALLISREGYNVEILKQTWLKKYCE